MEERPDCGGGDVSVPSLAVPTLMSPLSVLASPAAEGCFCNSLITAGEWLPL